MTKTISIPAELLPDVLELVSDAYVRLQHEMNKKSKKLSDLEFDGAKLRNRNEFLESENKDLHRIIEGACPPVGEQEETDDF